MIGPVRFTSIIRATRQAARVDVTPAARQGHVRANGKNFSSSQSVGFVDTGTHYWTIGLDGLSDTDTWTLG